MKFFFSGFLIIAFMFQIQGQASSASKKPNIVFFLVDPDLTGSNRTNTAYLLGNIIEPSGVIQDDYKLVVLTTRDGRIYSGNIIEENDRQVTMRIVGQDPVKISKSDIQSREVMEKSMMPEGLLNNLSEEEILDLVAFLKTTEE